MTRDGILKATRKFNISVPNVKKLGLHTIEEIKRLTAEGKTVNQISEELDLSIHSVRKFGGNIKGVKRRKKVNYSKEEWHINQLLRRARWRVDGSTAVIDDLLPLPTHCPILGIKLNYCTEDRPKDNTASIDRINPKIPYIKGNIEICSYRGNRIKNDSTIEELKKIIEYIEPAISTT